MKKELLKKSREKGVSAIEAVAAVGIFSLILVSVVANIFSLNRIIGFSGEKSRATFFAEEGLEAVRNMRDADFSGIIDGTHGLSDANGKWAFSGTQDVSDGFIRTIAISSVDSTTKKIQSTVSWISGTENKTVTLEERLTNWRVLKIETGGLLVYGDGGTASDAMKYRKYNGNDGTWGTVGSLADVDTATTNRAARSVRIYASKTRNEYIVLSRHYNGTTQYVYGQVWNGSSWGNAQMLSSWTSTTLLDVQNFDGTYLENGDFMAVYNDSTAVPKLRVWNGSSWGSQINMQTNSAYPVFVVVKARPGTNEVMAVFSGQSKRTETEYYNGNGYSTGNWTFVSHATNATSNTSRFADFAWSPTDAAKGALVYEMNGKYMSAKIFTANGSGDGSFSSAVNSPTQANNAATVSVVGRKGANEFMACNSDNKNPLNLTCFEISGFAPTWNTPTNNILTTSSVNGVEYGLDFSYTTSGSSGLAIYSDNATTPKLRTYNPNTHAFSSVTTMSSLGGALYSVRLIPDPNGEDIAVLLGDKSKAFFSDFFNGSTGALYATPSGKALVSQGSNGSANTDRWFDFAWKRN